MAKKNATLRDVAQMAGVSIATVSRLLNERNLTVQVSEATRRRVREAAQQLGYRPNRLARGLVTTKTNIIGLSLPVFAPPAETTPRFHVSHSSSMGALIDGTQTCLFPRGYDVLLVQRREYQNGHAARRVLPCLDIVDGVIYGTPNPAYDQYSAVLEQEVPLVFIGRLPSLLHVPHVCVDNEREMERITTALVAKGHRDIAFLLPLERNAPLSQSRFAGYRLALEKAGVPYREELVLESRYEDGVGRGLAKRLLALAKRPTAVVAGRPDLAVDVVMEFTMQGLRCPEDFEILSWGDDHAFLWLEPQITAFEASFHRMGEAAAELLLGIIEGTHEGPAEVQVACSLRERASCRLEVEDHPVHAEAAK